MSSGTATIIGVTGLIGGHLWELLKKDSRFSNIRLLVRRPFPHNDPKTEVKLVDFSDHESFRLALEDAGTVFCTVGTTQQKVKGDKQAYRKVDFEIPVNAARYAKANGCQHFLLVSAIGADSDSSNFYLQLKGEVEDTIKQLNLPAVSIFRPSILLGDRSEKRTGESIGKAVMQAFSFTFVGGLKKFKPVHAETVAAAMIEAACQDQKGVSVYDFEKMKALADK